MITRWTGGWSWGRDSTDYDDLTPTEPVPDWVYAEVARYAQGPTHVRKPWFRRAVQLAGRTVVAGLIAAGVFVLCLWLMRFAEYGDAELWAMLATLPWVWAAGTWAAMPPRPDMSALFYAPASTTPPTLTECGSNRDR